MKRASWTPQRRFFFLFWVLFGTGVPNLHAQGFVPAGSMSRSRIGHSSTLLQDGRVLIAGGDSTASAEVYDPDSGRFTETGAMTSPRIGHAAVLLPDGRVLLVGGCGATCSNNAELYDPGTETFTKTGNMSVAQNVGAAVLLRNGKVLALGDKTAELFDPASGTFVYLNSSRLAYNATLLLDGTVLVSGGTEASVFDPRTNQFRTMRYTSLGSAPATALPGGSVLFAGGYDPPYYPSSQSVFSWLYDPLTQSFGWATDMASPREFGTATLLKDGRVLLAGGYDGQGPISFNGIAYNGLVGDAEIYDPFTGKTTKLASNMVLHRDSHRATLLHNGRVLITGGRTSRSNWPPAPESVAELFVPENTEGTVPRLSLDRTQYCVGDSWSLQADGARPLAAIQISGTWDETPWTIPNWTTSGQDGKLAAVGTFGAETAGDYRVWIHAGGKVSNTVTVRIQNCQ